jgi:hypothetical protein
MDWTDERMDDLASRIDVGFARTDREIRDVRAEVKHTRDELKGDIAELRGELKGDIAELRGELKGEMREFRALLARVFVALLVGLLGLLAALVGVVASGALAG